MASRRYHSRDPVYVSVVGITGNYGFQTNLTTGDQGALGQQPVASSGAPVIFGANRPKPPRAIKKETDGSSVSSFLDSSKISAVPAGWRVSAGGKAPVGTSNLNLSRIRTVRVCVSVGQVKWAWDTPLETYNKISPAVLSALGVEILTGACWYKANRIENSGVPYTKPPRVRFVEDGEGGVDVLSSFCSPSKLDSLPVGWSPID